MFFWGISIAVLLDLCPVTCNHMILLISFIFWGVFKCFWLVKCMTCSTILQVALILQNSYLSLVVRLRINWSKMAGIASIHILAGNVC